MKLLSGSDIFQGNDILLADTFFSIKRRTIPIELTRRTKEASLGSPDMLPFKSD